jgi:hypothetical protein
MVAITSVTLSKLKTYDNWKNAPLGAILQTRAEDDTAIVGLRCESDLGVGRTAQYFLVLEGDHRGKLLAGETVRRHAIDVTSLLEVGVCELSPMPFSSEHRQLIGLVCEHGAGTGHFCVQVRSSGPARGFVWLSDPAKGKLEIDGADDLRRELIVVGLTNTIEIEVENEP